MSRKSSFREALERRAAAKVESPAASSSRTIRAELSASTISRPVDVVRQLTLHGVQLKKANNVLNRLADGEVVPVELEGEPRSIAKVLGSLGVSVRFISVPEVDIKQIREARGLSQAEFATLYCVELDTLQNWEQGRHSPDRFARVLLRVIKEYPHVVEAVVTGLTEGARDPAAIARKKARVDH